jgi:ABC-2 type transport system permease protein
MMQRIGLVAKREFLTTVSGKGFLIGVLVMPVLMIVLITMIPRILNSRTPQTQGDITVIDQTGHVLPDLKVALDPAKIAERRQQSIRRAANSVAPGMGSALPPVGPPVPALTVVEQPVSADLQEHKNWLSGQNPKARRHIALIVIHPDAVTLGQGKTEFGNYDIYEAVGLDDNTENVIHEALRVALVGARLKSSGLDPAAVETALRVQQPNAVIVAAAGEQQSRRGFNRILPFAMGILLFIGVMTGGQTLMTSTIEEKSSRVVEVLLAAVSPIELMWGKLLGQLGIGLVTIAVYVGLGMLALFQFAMIGLLDPMLVVYLFVFFLITYLVYGSLMMTVGAAVNQVADAQSLMGPIMILLIVPYVLAPIIGQAPNSVFSVAMSFIPPVNTFAMLARLASATPPPAWQAWLTVLVGIGASCAVVWFAAKVFKVGLLMHGKPPSFATLWKWARQA